VFVELMPLLKERTLLLTIARVGEKVKVNVDNEEVRKNRLKLLNQIRAATRAVADFSKIEG